MINQSGNLKLSKLLPPIILGNLFEWYDFSLYGYLAPLITKLFFPQIDSSLALVATFAIFATGFIARPIGALVFGYYGDKVGRRASLSISVLLMASATCLIGCLPTYQSVGVLAGVLLTICRLIQGFAIGGEFTVSVTYVIEQAPLNKRGLYGSFTMLGTFLGLLLGSISIAILESIFSSTELFNYGWRIPFILSFFLGFIGLFMRLKLPETADFLNMVEEKTVAKNPVIDVIRNYYWQILIAVSIVCLVSCSFSMWFIWLPSYLHTYSTIAPKNIFIMNSLNLLGITIIIPVIGLISDRLNKRMIFLVSGLGTIILIIPILMYMNQLTTSSVWLSQLILTILFSIAYAIVPITLFNIFPANVRCSGISISYNITNLIFGGTIPLLASLILIKTSNLVYQGIPIILSAIVMLIALSKIKRD